MPLLMTLILFFKGTDGNADTTFLTIDGSAAGDATFQQWQIIIADDGKYRFLVLIKMLIATSTAL